MKQISYDQENYVIGTACHLSKNFSEKEGVECVYLLSYKDGNTDKYKYDLTVIFDKEIDEEVKDVFAKINSSFSNEEILEIFGGQFSLVADINYGFIGNAINQRNKGKNLVSSEILYDKDGEYIYLSKYLNERMNVKPYYNTFKFGIEEPKILGR